MRTRSPRYRRRLSAASLMRLSANKRRMKLAKDVIAHIRAKLIKPVTATYFELRGSKYDDNFPSSSTQADLAIKEFSCEACAIGSLFVADVMLRDRATLQNVDNGTFRRRRLLQHFGREQLGLIESAFECTTQFTVGWSDLGPKAVRFGGRYKTSRGRMLAIMNNIVKNKGQFVP